MNTPNNDDFYLLQDILKRNYFNDFKKGNKKIEFLLSSNVLTLNSCSDCNIVESELYPNQDIFIPTQTNKFTNLLYLIDWYIENEFVCNIEFNGCIEDEDEGKLITTLTTILTKFSENPKHKHPKYIIFHTKMKNFKIISNIINLFKKDIQPIFYIHLNGYYCDKNLYDQKYYKDIFNWTAGNPLFYYKVNISHDNINNWIQNYKWWIINLGLNNFINQIYFEETLNDKWTYDLIQEYLNFIDFQIDFLFENLKDFKSYIFKDISNGYNKPFTIQILDQEILTNKKYYQNCLFHNSITIDLITFKIPMCCKLNYPIYHIGKFVLNDNNNLIIQPINISLLIPKAHLKRSSTPHCEYCNYLNICEKTCYGENFNVSYNPLCPIKESCMLQQCKYNFLIYKFQEMNLFNLDDYSLNSAFEKDLLWLQKRISQEGNYSGLRT